MTELHYNPSGLEETVEFIELRNISDTTKLDLTGVRLTDGPSEPFEFTGSNVTSLDPLAYVLIVSDVNAFTTAYPEVDRAIIAGAYQGQLSNGGETIKVEDALNSTILQFRYEDGRDVGEENWHPTTDGDGFSLVIRDEAAALDAWNTGSGWRPSVWIGGSPGAAAPSSPNVDFDGDGDVDADDLDLVSAGVQREDLRSDLNQDGVADLTDRSLMIGSILKTGFGDANLNTIFDSGDLVQVFRAGEYEDAIPKNSGWADGDWDGDGDFTTSDLVAAFQSGGYVRTAVASDQVEPLLFWRALDDEELRRRRERTIDAVWQSDDAEM